MPRRDNLADLLQTTVAASGSDSRWLTSRANVKAAALITASTHDTLIDSLIARASALIANAAGLAADNAGSLPGFALETFKATYRETSNGRGPELVLPWRVPLIGITGLIEDGATLTAGAGDFEIVSAIPGRLRRLSGGAVAWWSSSEIVVTFTAGWDLPENVPPDLEAAVIEQVKAMVFAADRDPAIRSENMPDLAAVSYAIPGGDTFKGVLLPQVVDAISRYANPLP